MSDTQVEAVAIGASAGALEALSAILPGLPSDFPLPILVVVHLPPDRESIMAELLQARCALDVKEAEDKEPIRGGTVYLAPPDYHLLVEDDRRLSLSGEEAVHYSRPSIDVLFESASDAYGPALVGVVLTGANNDGARGLAAVSRAGGIAIVQAPELSYSAAMPLAAIDACPEARTMSFAKIVASLLDLVAQR